MRRKDVQVAELKSALIKVLEAQTLNYHMIVDLIREPLKEYPLSTVGNCLRVLKKQGYIKDIMVDGVRFWSRTHKEFDDQPPIKVLVPLPARTHRKIAEMAVEKGVSKISVIKSLINSAIKDSL